VAASGVPTVRQRRLAAELRHLRGKRTGEEVAAAIGWSPSKVSRYELGRTTPRLDEIEQLLDYYGVPDAKRAQLLALAREATQKGWWEDYADALPREYMAFIGLEAEAISIAQWQTEVVPGILQTEDYARQVHRGVQRVQLVPPSMIERRVKVRMIRQEALTRQNPLELSVVLDEAVLRRRIGDRSVMRAQLQYLAQAAELRNVTLRVVPLEADHHIVTDSFVIFHFDVAHETTLHDVVCTEHSVASESYVESETETHVQRLLFEGLVADSLSPQDSRDLVLKILGSFQK
jgi:transcriptional regulator with XRE-family HTH domain